MPLHVLIVEDEQALAHVMRDYLEQAGYRVSCLYDGADVVSFVSEQSVDLMLLDLMLPNKDGISVCREVRDIKHALPIVMTTAKVEEIDRLLGLEMGADDYVCKPYSPREVVARVKAIFRRIQATDAGLAPTLQLDEHSLSVRYRNDSLQLTEIEYQLLSVLMRRSGMIFSRQSLIDEIYSDYRVVSDRTVDSHVKKLRKKLSELNGLNDVELIVSVYGVGYKFEFPED